MGMGAGMSNVSEICKTGNGKKGILDGINAGEMKGRGVDLSHFLTFTALTAVLLRFKVFT